MLLYLYIGSTVYVWINTIKSFHDMNKRLKKEGFTFNQKGFGGVGDIVISGLFALALSVPVINLVFPLSGIDKERSYDEYKNYLLEAGAIDEPDETLVAETKDKVLKISDAKLYGRVNTKGHIYYSSMNHYDSNEEEKGKVLKKEFNHRH